MCIQHSAQVNVLVQSQQMNIRDLQVMYSWTLFSIHIAVGRGSVRAIQLSIQEAPEEALACTACMAVSKMESSSFCMKMPKGWNCTESPQKTSPKLSLIGLVFHLAAEAVRFQPAFSMVSPNLSWPSAAPPFPKHEFVACCSGFRPSIFLAPGPFSRLGATS